MNAEELLSLELALEDRLRVDLNALPVRPYAFYRDAAMQRLAAKPGTVGRVFASARVGTTIAVALLFALAAAFVLLNLRGPSSPAGPTPIPRSSATPPASLGSTASGSPAVTPSAAPTPTDFVLPQGCAYVGEPIVEQPAQIVVTTWYFNCGAAPDLGAIERFTPVFAQQGWTMCSSGPGRGVWWKGTLQTAVGQSAEGNPVLTQLARQSQDCP